MDKDSYALKNWGVPEPTTVCFDPETISLQGVYRDELSLFRAKKKWADTLEISFMLEHNKDFSFTMIRHYEELKFILFCHFHTASGRYAFWRLTNYQAPDAQYLIETAHMPERNLAFTADDTASPPELTSIDEEPALFNTSSQSSPIKSTLEKILRKLLSYRNYP